MLGLPDPLRVPRWLRLCVCVAVEVRDAVEEPVVLRDPVMDAVCERLGVREAEGDVDCVCDALCVSEAVGDCELEALCEREPVGEAVSVLLGVPELEKVWLWDAVLELLGL
jgi:hypothetical protein